MTRPGIELAQSARGTECTDCFSAEGYDTPPTSILDMTKQFESEVPVIQELWGMQITSSLPSLPGPLWLEAVAPDRVLSMGQIELNYVMLN